MKLIIVRHAQTDENLQGGDAKRGSEVLLNQTGVAQAKKLGKHLSAEGITHAYVSPQRRAVHTAEEILAHHADVPVIHVDHLKEQSLGVYEDLPKDEFKKARKDSGEPFHIFRPKEGESYADVQARAAQFLDQLITKHHEDTVLIVSHGGTVGMLLLHILGKDITEENYKAHKPDNTAVTILEIVKDAPVRLYTLNSLRHLDEKD